MRGVSKEGDPLEALQVRIALAVADAQASLGEALQALALCHATATLRSGVDGATIEVAKLVARVKWLGELGARVGVRFPAAEPAAPELFASFVEPRGFSFEVPMDPAGAVPDVGFDDAVDALAKRDPVGADDLARIGLSVAALYAPAPGARGQTAYPTGFAAARAASTDLARRVRDLLVTDLEEGAPTPETVARIVARWDFPVSYAANVVRTNYATATSAGRARQVEHVAATTGLRIGYRVSCVLDSDLRSGRPRDHGEDHKAMDGFTARQDDQVWLTHFPPYGYQCRCVATVVFGAEVPEGFVKAPAGASFAKGFGRKPV